MVSLGLLGQAVGVSADANTVVGHIFNLGVGPEAIRWTSSEGVVRLGDLAGGPFASEVTAVSADGNTIVGMGSVAVANIDNAGEAFRWTSASGMVGLGDLPGGDYYSRSAGVSADGSTIVGISSSSTSWDGEAFRWTSVDGMVGLGDLPGGFNYSRATAVSADGSKVVGESSGGNGSIEAILWTGNAGMQTLSSILTDGGADLTGWELWGANAISANGRWIAGYGKRGNALEAFLADLGGQPQSVVPDSGVLTPAFAFIVFCLGAVCRRKE